MGPNAKHIILRVVGNNRKGGARKYCFHLNAYLKALGQRTLTYIPRAPSPDPLSDKEAVPFEYRHFRSDIAYLWFMLRFRRQIRYAHLHLRNVIMLASPLLVLLGVPYVVTCHATIGTPKGLRGRFQARSYIRALSRSAGVIFISEFVRADTFGKLGLTDLPVANTVIHNGSEHPSSSASWAHDDDGVRIVVVGELTARKGIADYARLLDLLQSAHSGQMDRPPVTIAFYGKGPLEPLVRELERKSNRQVAVVHEGYADNPGDIFGPADLHLILARDEAFGRVVTEAMSFGVPTIALRAGAFPEIISDGVDGLLVDSADDAAAAILALDLMTVQRFGKAALDSYERSFTIERSCAATVDFIEAHISRV